MAYFAKLDENNYVIAVHTVANEALDPNNEEESGIAFYKEWSGGYERWKQTSFNGKIRKNFAGVGYFYDVQKDAFIPPQPYPSWILNEETCLWEAPKKYPDETKPYYWDESDQNWILIIET